MLHKCGSTLLSCDTWKEYSTTYALLPKFFRPYSRCTLRNIIIFSSPFSSPAFLQTDSFQNVYLSICSKSVEPLPLPSFKYRNWCLSPPLVFRFPLFCSGFSFWLFLFLFLFCFVFLLRLVFFCFLVSFCLF